MQSPKLFAFLSSVFFLGLTFQYAAASTVLTIDITNPAAVKFIGVAANSQTNSSLNIGSDGFTLENLFASAVTIPSTSTGSGDLKPTGSSFAYSMFGTFNFDANDGVFGPGNDLSVYSNGATTAGSQIFSTASRAFNGTLTANFSTYAAALPATGTTGNVYSGYFQSGPTDHGLVVGQFIVIPEPTSAMVCALGLIPFCLRRRK